MHIALANHEQFAFLLQTKTQEHQNIISYICPTVGIGHQPRTVAFFDAGGQDRGQKIISYICKKCFHIFMYIGIGHQPRTVAFSAAGGQDRGQRDLALCLPRATSRRAVQVNHLIYKIILFLFTTYYFSLLLTI